MYQYEIKIITLTKVKIAVTSRQIVVWYFHSEGTTSFIIAVQDASMIQIIMVSLGIDY
jgi:hypothetical protein